MWLIDKVRHHTASLSRTTMMLYVIYFSLMAMATVVQLSALSFLADGEEGNSIFFVLMKFFALMGSSIVLFFFVSEVNRSEKALGNTGLLLYIISVLLIMLVPFLGDTINHARRSISLRYIGLPFFSIQPTEFYKIAVVFMGAFIFGDNPTIFDNIGERFVRLFRKWIPHYRPQERASLSFMLMVFFPLLFVFKDALSMTAYLVVLSFIMIIYGGGVDKLARWVMMLTVLFSITGFFALREMPEHWVKSKPLTRLETWRNRVIPDYSGLTEVEYNALNGRQQDSMKYVITDANRQEKLGYIAIARGMSKGMIGPGGSEMRHFMAEIYNDFVFVLILEEYGWLGLLLVPLVYIILVYNVRVIGRRAKNRFMELLLYGITTSLVLQAFVNMFVAVGLFPVTGQTLPILSYGGSSLWAVSVQFGLLVAMAKMIYKQKRIDEAAQEAETVALQEVAAEGVAHPEEEDIEEAVVEQ